MGIVVTPQEQAASEAAARASIVPKPSDLQWYQDLPTLLPQALAQVYEQGKDPQQVYASELQPHGFTQDEWRYLQGRTAEGRAKLEQQYARGFQGLSGGNIKVRINVAKQKLDAELNQRGPQFAQDLQQRERALVDVQPSDPTLKAKCGL